LFDVLADGRALLRGYDIARTAGRDRAAVERLGVEVTGGRLIIGFDGRRGSDAALVSAVRIARSR
jgi:hypothetical protein